MVQRQRFFPGHPARAELQSLLTWGTIEPMKNQASTKVILFMLLLYLIWGFNWVVMRIMSWSIALGMALIFIGIFAVLGFGAGKSHQLNS